MEPIPDELKQTIALLVRSPLPASHRVEMLMRILMETADDPSQQRKLCQALLQTMENGAAFAEFEAEKARLKQTLTELSNGPMRQAVYVDPVGAGLASPLPRVRVVLADGHEALPLLNEVIPVDQLKPGMTVFLDAKASVVLAYNREFPRVGQEARFLRRLPDSQSIEVELPEGKLVCHAAAPLLEAIDAGRVRRGDNVVYSHRQQFAFAPIPVEDNHRHRFVDSSRIAEIDIAREIGRPHWILKRLIDRTRLMLLRPDLLERFALRPRYSVFLTGPSGTGKTLTIKAYLSEYHRLIRNLTGRADLGSRVVRVKASDLLSEWFGVTDRKIDQLFDDILALASERFDLNGVSRTLPIVVIFEEAEGLLHRRGDHDGAVYDRVIGTLLQRLDDPLEQLSHLPIIWITTSNAPHLVDSAAWRRLANVRARFTRLDRDGFVAVMQKKLRPEIPLTVWSTAPAPVRRRELLDRLTGWFFSPNGEDQGVLELTLRDGRKLTRFRRDFLTGALCEQAVADAIDGAVVDCENSGDPTVGLDADRLITAFVRATDGLADNVTPQNAGDYLDLPEHVNVASVRRLRVPAPQLGRLINRLPVS